MKTYRLTKITSITIVIVIVAMVGTQRPSSTIVYATDNSPHLDTRVFIPLIDRPLDFRFTYYVAPNVVASEERAARLGLQYVQNKLTQAYGGNIEDLFLKKIVVRVIAEGNGMPGDGTYGCNVTSENNAPVILLNTSHWCWKLNTYEHRQHTAAHEFAHAWQYSLLSGNLWSPIGLWLSEGQAEVIGYDSVIPYAFTSMIDVREERLNQAIARGVISRSLKDMETGSTDAYEMYFLAADRLVQIAPSGKLSFRIYLQQLANGIPDSQAFKSAFGISRVDFYAQFPNYISQLRGGTDIIFRDTFDLSTTGFYSSTFSWGAVGLSNGKYFWSTNNDTVNWAIPSPASSITSSYSVEIAISWDVAHDGGHGLMFGGRNGEHFRFLINPSSGKYELIRLQNTGGYTETAMINWTSSTAIQSASLNKLKVEHRGSQVKLFINDSNVANLDDIVFVGGSWNGLANVVIPTKTTKTYFDDFYVRVIQ